MMSYEVAMGISLIGAFLVAGSLEPGFIAAHGASTSMSASNPLNWLWLWQPVALVLFFTAAIAETKRAPFDIPEGEPEIIGYFVEYSGLRWGLFFLAEFVEIVFISAVITTVFFGGYQVPFLDADGFRIGGEMAATLLPASSSRPAARSPRSRTSRPAARSCRSRTGSSCSCSSSRSAPRCCCCAGSS